MPFHPTRSMIKRSLTLSLLALGCGGPPTPSDALSSDMQLKHVESFDQVWTTIKDSHWDPDLGGVDWEGARDELRPKIQAATTTSEAREIIGDLISRLGQSHFGIIPEKLYEEVTDEDELDLSSGGNGHVGIDVRVADGVAIVTEVREGAARDAGVKPGWTVDEVDGRATNEILDRVVRLTKDARHVPYFQTTAILSRLRGPIGESVPVTFTDMTGTEQSMTLTRTKRDGKPAKFGHLPLFHLRFETRRLDSGVGYIAFNSFLDPSSIMNSFGEAVREYADAPGIIIDLRGNPGGIGAMAMGMAGWFVQERNKWLGVMDTRQMSLKFAVNPRTEAFDGLVAVLVDELSMSTSEILAGGLQDLDRARVFGLQTPGAALPSTIERLPNGDGFQYAFANYTSAGGVVLEGHGVTPDEIVPLNRQALAAGRDPVIETAVDWIRNTSRSASR